MSRRTVGFDALHPAGGSIQVASAYDQQDLVAEAYGTSFLRDGIWVTPHQVTAAITRRLVLLHAFQFLRADGHLLLHPSIADEQVRVAMPDGQHADDASRLGAALEAAGVRATLQRSVRPTVALQDARVDGVPLRVAMLATRDGRTRWILVRGDDGRELHIEDAGPGAIAQTIRDAIADVGAAMDAEADANAAARYLQTDDAGDDLAGWTGSRGIVDVPAVPDRTQLVALEATVSGETLGTYTAPTTAECVITGRPTSTRAVLGPRG